MEKLKWAWKKIYETVQTVASTRVKRFKLVDQFAQRN